MSGTDYLITLTDAINQPLQILTTYKLVSELVKKISATIPTIVKRQFFDINEIFKEYKMDNIQSGDIIETRGLLLEYAQIMKPYTQIDGMFQDFKPVSKKTNFKEGKFITSNKAEVSGVLFNPPIQKIPDDDNLGFAFLYDENFSTFLYTKNNSFDNLPVYEKESKPILVLYDLSLFSKYINKKVEIKAKVINLPSKYIENFKFASDDRIRELNSNYIDILSDNKDFICLILDKTDTKVEIYDNKISEKIMAPLYLESKMDNINLLSKEKQIELISSILPNLPQRMNYNFPAVIVNTDLNIGNAFISTNDINVVYRQPNIIGFYTVCPIFSKSDYEKKLNEFSVFYNNFCLDYAHKSKKHIGLKSAIHLNFIFDYRKKFIFDKQGVLYEKETVDNIRTENIASQKWLNTK